MPNMFQMMKQMREVKRIQKELERKVVEVKNSDGTVTVQTRGDMTVKSLTIDPRIVDPSRCAQLEKTIVSTINSALESSKKSAAEEMSKLASGLGISGLPGM